MGIVILNTNCQTGPPTPEKLEPQAPGECPPLHALSSAGDYHVKNLLMAGTVFPQTILKQKSQDNTKAGDRQMETPGRDGQPGDGVRGGPHT